MVPANLTCRQALLSNRAADQRSQCDEKRPSCNNCVRRQKKCSLCEVTKSAAEDSAGKLSSLEPRPESGPKAQTSFDPLATERHFSKATRLKELHLMHHYGTTTCETLGLTTQQVKLWKTAIPKEALRHEFLMEGLLSIAALHCAHLDPSMGWAYTEAAIQYQNSGLIGYRTALLHINDTNYEAIFIFSVILTVLGFAMPAAYTERQPVSPAETIISIYELLKGITLTTQVYAEAIRGGMFSPLFQNLELRVSSPCFMPEGEIVTAMVRLRQRAEFMTKYVGTETREIYIASIDSLEESFRDVGMSRSVSNVVAWPIMVGHKMVHLFKQGDPMALLVWVHYGVLALEIHDQWWGKNFGIRLIEDLSATLHGLDPEWASWTEWARKCALLVA
ncbi:C6 transcription factor [Colletotrichum tofieldiae]|uniref:C6 transcription factor n=1 Tax=Colletotrichum tofieldiae TaxID=708197 RepID=A0A166Z595_9PEZI|nr:C6 transcription factor [Colletotrichum tofieldiae]